MKNQYTADQIIGICKVSKASFYELKKKNKDFVNENSTRIHRIVYYNQAVMDFFLAYYQPDEKAESEKTLISDFDIDTEKKEPVSSMNTDGAEARPKNSFVEATEQDNPPEGQRTALQRKIEALEAEIEALRNQLTASEEERKELLRQNGAILLVLQQEKQEKQLFLPAPKKSFSDKLKTLFKKN